MSNPTEENNEYGSRQDEISAESEDQNKADHPKDDSFKTPPRNHRMGWEQPMDEQMYDSFDDIREQGGTSPADEEAD